MKKTLSNIFAILTAGVIFTVAAYADVKIKIRQSASGQTSEYTTYIKGKRERAEQNAGGMQSINITQCDLKRSLQIMPAAQVYLIDAWQSTANVAPSTETQTVGKQTQKGGVVVSTITTKDTGERKQMFGFTARHLIITSESVPSADACQKDRMKMETDGWYIDAAFALDCQTERYKNYSPRNENGGGCHDRYEVKQIGAVKTGYPVYEKMTFFDASGNPSFTNVREVVELSNQTLDAALFDVPAGYREVKSSTELYASLSSGRSSGDSDASSAMSHNVASGNSTNGNTGLNSGVKNMSGANSNVSSQVGPKQAGVVRIGLAQVRTGAVGEGLNAQELSAAVGNTLGQYLKSPGLELVQLEAKLPSAIDAEAKQKECDYVINSQVSHKKGGGGGFGGMFGKTLGSAVAQTGIGHTGSTAGNIAGQIATQSIVAATLTQNVKSKDEITLDIKLEKNGAPALAKQFKAKAKGDGDDIITQVVEQAAEAVVGTAK